MGLPAIPKRDKRDRVVLEELAAFRSDLVETVSRHVEWLLDYDREADLPITPAEATTRARRPGSRDLLEQEPQQVSWHDLANSMEHRPDHARAAWEHVKEAAREELRMGVRGARSVERTFSEPYERAQYLVILEALREALGPRDGVEDLLVQQMAGAYEQGLRWQARAVERVEHESWAGERSRRWARENMRPAERERDDADYGWIPPRLSDAAAIDQAATLADRYQRSFLRLLRTFREMRGVVGALVMTGGQLNVAEKQIVTAAHAPVTRRRPRRAGPRCARPTARRRTLP